MTSSVHHAVEICHGHFPHGGTVTRLFGSIGIPEREVDGYTVERDHQIYGRFDSTERLASWEESLANLRANVRVYANAFTY